MPRQDDIEIYVKGADPAVIKQWLAGVFQRVTLNHEGKKLLRGEVILNDDSKPCELLVIENAVKGYTSIWFKQNHTPWDTDIDCARSAWKAMGREVRANADGWSEGAEADLFHCIDESGESTVVWPT